MFWEETRLDPYLLFNPIKNIGSLSRGRKHAIDLGLQPSEITYYDLSQVDFTPREKTLWCELYSNQLDSNKLSLRSFVSR
jgi:hypothetical protein